MNRESVKKQQPSCTNSRKELRRNCSPIGNNNTKNFFVSNPEPASSWIFGNSLVRLGTQGVFRPYLKTFVAPFLPTRLTAPRSPRMRPSLLDGNVDTDLLIHQVHCCVNEIIISMKIDFDIFEGTVLNLIQFKTEKIGFLSLHWRITVFRSRKITIKRFL